MRVIGAGPRLAIQPRHRFEIVIHDVGRRLRQHVERAIQASAEVRDQHFDLRSRRVLANGADAIDKMTGAAVAQIIPVDARYDDVTKAKCGDRLRQVDRLLRVERQRTPVPDIAERTAPRADVAHDHERRRSLAEALADVGARRLLAHRMQTVLAEDLLDLVEPRRRRRAHANPFRLAQPLGGDDLDRDASSLGQALVLDARRIGRRGIDAGGCGVFVHAPPPIAPERTGASSSPAVSTVRVTPNAATCVTASPG